MIIRDLFTVVCLRFPMVTNKMRRECAASAEHALACEVETSRNFMNPIFQEIEALKAVAGWFAVGVTPRKWWLTFEREYCERPEVIRELLLQLQKRQATIDEFFLAYVYSDNENIKTNLDYLDYAIDRGKGKRPLAAEDFRDKVI